MALLSRLAHGINNAMGGAPARMAANHYLKRFGHMTMLKIDSVGKTIEAEIELKGEKEPIRIAVGGYSLTEQPGGGALFSAKEVTVSREWMQVLARELLAKGVPVPAEAAKWAGLVL